MKATIHSKRTLFDDFFRIEEAMVSHETFAGGESQTVRRLSFERGDSVAAIVMNRSTRKILLVNQFKYPTHHKGPGWITETVAGMLEADEDPAAALRREIFEEMGYEVSHMEPISEFYLSPGGSSERVLLYYAEVDDSTRTGPGGGLTAENEDIKTLSYTLSDLRRMVASGEIADAKTIIGILWLNERQGAGS